MNSSHTPIIDQQKSSQCSTSHHQSTKSVQWVGTENMLGEEPIMSGEMGSKPVVDGLESSVPLVVDNTVTHGVINSSLSHVPSEVHSDQPLVRTRNSEVVDSGPTTAHAY